ncbi:alpha/beta fold hydrolase [Candidatus Poribacteria bacterium]|nr:alpha/beta fold hydrolase [Candidatus Poribacteria bacterium]
MKYNIHIIFILLVFFPSISLSQVENHVGGHWEGTIEIPNQPLNIKIGLSKKDGSWTGTIDIPAQGATGLSLTDFHIDETKEMPTIKFSINGVPGNPTFDGQLQEQTIKGKFTQASFTFDFHLSRKKFTPPSRPQEPKPPFPYNIEEVEYKNGIVNLAGTLTLPNDDGPFPAVLLITGSGLQDRDETIFGHKPFWVIADYLTRAGIVVLRVDDPGFGKSTPHPKSPTTADFATDVEAGVAFLKKDERIASVGLIGHSEGGAIASIVASRNDDVKFIVLLAAPGVVGSELLRKQNERIFDAMGFEDERKIASLSLLDNLFTILSSDESDEKLHPQVSIIARKQFELNGIHPDKVDESMIQASVKQALNPWMRYFLTFNPKPYLQKINIPVLALNGELDVQVDTEQNINAIAKTLEQSGNQNVTIHRLQGLNHLFQTAKTGLVDEYAVIEETISPEVLKIIKDWILSVTQ